MIKVPPIKLKANSVRNITLPISALQDEPLPVGSSPSLYLPHDCWLQDGAILVPQGTYPRKMMTVKISLANVINADIDFEGGEFHGDIAVSSVVPDVWIPLAQHLKMIKLQKKSRSERKAAARKGQIFAQ